MVPLLTVASGFEGRVVAARLGSEGIVVSLRGAVDGPYPVGDVFVDVESSQAAAARALLLADEVEAVFASGGDPAAAGAGDGVGAGRSSRVVAASAVIVLAAVAVLLATSLVRLATADADARPRVAPALR